MPLSGVASSARQDTGNQSQQYCVHIPRNPTVTNSTDRRISSQCYPLSAAAVCDTSTLTVDGNVRIVWIIYQYLNCINLSDDLCVFPETHRRNLDIRQHAENTNITTPPSSTDKETSGHTTSVWQIRGVMLWLVALSVAAIRHQSSPPLCFAVLCMLCHACDVSRVWRAP